MRKFLIKISYTVLPMWLILVGMATYLWAINDNSGDLMRLGMINIGAEYTDSMRETALPEIYPIGENDESRLRQMNCDVLIIGDSFSHGGGIGRRGDYVNYIQHDGGRKVTVLYPDFSTENPLQTAYDLLNLGLIDSTNVKNLVMQEGERYLVDRHNVFKTTNTEIFSPLTATAGAATGGNGGGADPSTTGPLLRVKDFVFYRLLGADPIYKKRLDRDMFTCDEPSKLYFFFEDVEMGFNVTAQQQQAVINGFDALIAKAQEKGVNLVILIACDKYDLYQDFIVDNTYPRKTLADDVEQWTAPQREHFVYAKPLLLPRIQQGVKDVFLFNDTHWSPASSRVIAADIIKKLK